ncbi:MAG TPA: glutamate-5-semialdehyde dehydrogenase [Dermatophilaceae bacterium]|nr:glutamate-5-semialdehyde dehydrogenase [Dermatophilaceae bacterium]
MAAVEASRGAVTTSPVIPPEMSQIGGGMAGGRGARGPAAVETAQDPTTTRVRTVAAAAREASRALALLSRAEKDIALHAMADALEAAGAAILGANETDLERGRSNGMPAGLQDRLRLDQARLTGIAEALHQVATLPDPVGEVVRGSTLANGLQIRQVRVPFGVIGMIYEARPNVTVDAAGLGLKSGNAVILRGGSAAASSNRALVNVLRQALVGQGLPADAICLLDDPGRDAAIALMRARGLVDVIIPRGGAELIATVVRESSVPVIETGSGNVHVYVDRAADPAMALDIVVNSKTQRPSVCNAAETLLVHSDLYTSWLPQALRALSERGVVLHGDARARAAAGESIDVHPASDLDYDTEFHALEMAVAVVDSLDEALRHVRRFSTGHTEAIVTEDRAAARRWVAEVDAAVVMVNASTRFTDGAEFGFGAEIGISTQKLHARGPMALAEMTSTKWIVEGDGQVRD